MANAEGESGSLEVRLVRLERSNQRLRLGGLAALVLGLSFVFVGARSLLTPRHSTLGAATFTTVTARQFVLVDSTGRSRAELVLGGNGAAALDFLDSRGNFAGDVSGEDLSLFGPGGLSGSGEVVLESGAQPSLTLGDQNAHVKLSGGAQPSLILHSQDTWAELLGGSQSLQPYGTVGPALLISDRNNFSINIGVTPTQSPDTGETQQTSAASIILLGKPDKNGYKHVIWRAPSR